MRLKNGDNPEMHPEGRRNGAGRFANRLYDVLLLVLPSWLREEAGEEMRQIFRVQWRETQGVWRRSLLILLTVLDTARTAIWSWPHSYGSSPVPQRSKRLPLFKTQLEITMGDIRHAFRSLIKNPAFSLMALLVLSLGVGANATILTLVDRLFFTDPPHVEAPDQLVRVMRTSDSGSEGGLAYPDFRHYRDNNETFTELAAYDEGGFAVTIVPTSDGKPSTESGAAAGERVSAIGWFVTDNYFAALGTQPQVGRFFLAEENEVPGRQPVAVISDQLWTNSFERSRDVLGSAILLNGNRFDVIGVAPRGFRGISPLETPPDIWVPIVSQPTLAPLGANYALERVEGARWVWLRGVGRLNDGETIEHASANLEGLATYLQENFAEWSEGWGVALAPHAGFNPSDRAGLLSVTRLLFGAVALLLLIVGANIAILMLARGSQRARETGVRLALGASRWRVARQVLVENLLLAFGAGLLGVGIARVCANLAAAWMPMSFALDFAPGPRVVVAGLLLAAVVAFGASLAPALQGSRFDLNALIRNDSTGSSRPWMRGGLVVLQVALSMMLVVGAALFARSVATARAVDLGFETENRVMVSVSLRNHGYSPEDGKLLVSRALERLRALPEVDSVTTTMMVPFRGATMTNFSPIERAAGSRSNVQGTASDGAQQSGDGDDMLFSGYNQVGPDYFETMAMNIVLGRGISRTDDDGAPGVMVVNERLAETAWPGEDPIGKLVEFREDSAPLEVVGVAANATYYELGEEPTNQFWVAAQQNYSQRVRFMLESRGGLLSVGERARAVLLDLDANLAVPPPTLLDESFRTEIARYQTAARLVSLFGILALVLASVGLYGVLTYSVVQRTREIGIRVALGATGSRVASTIVGRGLRLTAIGAAVGLVGALVGTRFLVSFLYGVEPTDLVTFVSVPIALLGVASLACLMPARRAAEVDPVRAMRAD